MNYTVFIKADKVKRYYKSAVDEYIKRLGRYCNAKYEIIKSAEKHRVLGNNKYKIQISSGGKAISSEEFAVKINNFSVKSINNISIYVGGCPDYDENISVSPMEMDAGLTAVIICEQIYRAYRILNGEPYHK